MKTYFPVAIALLVGAALGYCLAPASPAPSVEHNMDEDAKVVPTQVEGDAASTRALRARVRELEKMLARRGVEAEKTNVDETERATRRGRRFDPRAEMERLKKEDPARFAQMTNRMAQFRRRRLEHAQYKMDILDSVDTSKMSAEARQIHEALQNAIEEREALEEKMRNFMDMSDEDRRQVMEKMHEVNGRIRELNGTERDNLIAQTVESLGLDGDDAMDVVETVKAIYEATTDHGRGFGPGGSRRHGERGEKVEGEH